MGRRASSLGAVFALFLLAPALASATALPQGFGETILADGDLTGPTAVDWAPDGRMFVAEKGGTVRVVMPDGTLLPTPLLDIADQVNSFSDRGLVGLAVDTDFATNRYLYLLYVYELNPLDPDSLDPMVSRLTRVTVNPDNTLENPADPETVILGTEFDQPCPIPDNTVDCITADFKWHVVGTVRSDPDGTLWVGMGDNHAPTPIDDLTYRPYDEHSFAGKIIHIDRDGRGLANHPFCPGDADLTHVCTKIYAKGFRNPFRFTLRPGKGPVVGDVGDAHEEEIDLVRAGESYGWPCYEGKIRTVLYESEPRCQEEYAKEGTPDAASPPSWSYEHQGANAAVIAGPVYQGDNYPSDYNDQVFVGDYVQGWVKRLTVNSNDEVTAVEDFAADWPPGVDLELMPNGDLAYVDIGLGSTGSVRRFTYADGNLPPAPVASATPNQGDPPLTVQFTGSDSTDPEDDPLTYDWDFGDGSPHSSEADPTHIYASAGTFSARLTVDDGHDRNPNTTATIQVGPNVSPTAAITAPGDESRYRDGEVVELAGGGDDAEDGSLTGAALSWQVLLRHGTHLHAVVTLAGEQGQFTPFDDHDADSHYEIILTATDSGGLSAEHRIEIRPETTELALASSPPGAPIRYAGTGPFAAPLQRTAAVGFKAAIEADQTFEVQGRAYSFDHWSHGGAQKQVLTVPAADTTLTAVYESETPSGTAPSGTAPSGTAPSGTVPADTAAPRISLEGTKNQNSFKVVTVKVSSSEAGTATGEGTIKARVVGLRKSSAIAAKKKQFTLRGQTRDIAAGETATLRLKPKEKAKRKIRQGKRANAKVTVTVTDAAGNESQAKRKVKLKRR